MDHERCDDIVSPEEWEEEDSSVTVNVGDVRRNLTASTKESEQQRNSLDESDDVDVENIDEDLDTLQLSTGGNVGIGEPMTELEEKNKLIEQLEDRLKKQDEETKQMRFDLDKGKKSVKVMVTCVKHASVVLTRITEKLNKRADEPFDHSNSGGGSNANSSVSEISQGTLQEEENEGSVNEEGVVEHLRKRLGDLITSINRREAKVQERLNVYRPFVLPYWEKFLAMKKGLPNTTTSNEVAGTNKASVSGNNTLGATSSLVPLDNATRTIPAALEGSTGRNSPQPGTSRQLVQPATFRQQSAEEEDDDDIMIIEDDGTLTSPKQPPRQNIQSYDNNQNQPNTTLPLLLLHTIKVDIENDQPVDRKIHKRDLTKRGIKDYYYCTCGIKFGNREKGLHSHMRFWNGGYIKNLWNSTKVNSSSPKRVPKIYSEEEKKFPCDFCGERFIGVSNRKSHLEKVHKIRDHRKEIGCRACGSTFLSWDDFYHHRRLIHGGSKKFVPTTPATPGSSSRSTTEVAPPPRIPPSFGGESNINTQQRKLQHGHDKNKAAILGYFCKCGVKHLSDSSLNAHIRYMKGLKQFTCKVCQLGFRTKTSLLVHMAQRHKENLEKSRKKTRAAPFKCSCGVGFYHVKMLEKHSRTHTHRQSFKCSQCWKKFTECNKLIEHEKKYHNVIVL